MNDQQAAQAQASYEDTFFPTTTADSLIDDEQAHTIARGQLQYFGKNHSAAQVISLFLTAMVNEFGIDELREVIEEQLDMQELPDGEEGEVDFGGLFEPEPEPVAISPDDERLR